MRILTLIITLFHFVFSSRLSIDKDKFMLDNKLINLNSASEGILLNSRMIQGCKKWRRVWIL